MPSSKQRLTQKQAALKHGWRSGLEERVAEQLKKLKVPYKYEELKINYTVPESFHVYTPDFQLPNGIIIETKGHWVLADRKKQLLVRQQHPELDIRMVFSNSRQKISKTSKTSYGSFCDRHGILYADKEIPKEWIDESSSSV